MPTCLVLMPFGKTTEQHTEEYWNNHFMHFIRPAVEDAADGKKLLGYRAMRANPSGGSINEEVFNNLQDADVVLADLTDLNANVMYELGICHCLRERTIMILEKGLEIPFYFKGYKIISYSGATNKDSHKFKEDIQRRLLDLTQDTTSIADNPVTNYFRSTGRKVSITPIGSHVPGGLRESEFKHLYTPSENSQRNARKAEVIREAEQYIKLLASSGYTYLVKVNSPFRDALEERLKQKVPVRIVLLNPWSDTRMLLALGELSEDSSIHEQIQRIGLEKLQQGSLRGFDPVKLIEQSDNYLEKYSTSIRGYLDIQRRYGALIELRICSYPIPSTILLTEKMGFFEPYIYANLHERMRKAMITFELEFPVSNYLYRHCTDHFEIMWQLSVPYEKFVETEDSLKEQLRGRYDWKTDSPGSAT
jgi:hypothetical protein